MPQKAKQPKQKPQPKVKVELFKPNINLLKNMNAAFLVAGFVASLFTVYVLSNKNHNNDIRSRGQEIATPTPTPIDICPTGVCETPTPSEVPGY